MALVSETFPSKYISAADLKGGSALVAIDRTEFELLNNERKLIVYFQGKQKGLVLNKTNAQAIAQAYGDDTDQWSGAEVELFTIWTDYQGKQTEAVRVRIPMRRPAAQQPATKKPFPGEETENPGF